MARKRVSKKLSKSGLRSEIIKEVSATPYRKLVYGKLLRTEKRLLKELDVLNPRTITAAGINQYAIMPITAKPLSSSKQKFPGGLINRLRYIRGIEGQHITMHAGRKVGKSFAPHAKDFTFIATKPIAHAGALTHEITHAVNKYIRDLKGYDPETHAAISEGVVREALGKKPGLLYETWKTNNPELAKRWKKSLLSKRYRK